MSDTLRTRIAAVHQAHRWGVFRCDDGYARTCCRCQWREIADGPTHAEHVADAVIEALNLDVAVTYLVHGEVAAQGALEGCTMGHAWIEYGETVIDTSNGRHIVMPKMLYYAIGHIGDLDNTHVYTPEQVREMVLEHGHYGPWELKGKHPMYQRGITDITPVEDDEDELE